MVQGSYSHPGSASLLFISRRASNCVVLPPVGPSGCPGKMNCEPTTPVSVVVVPPVPFASKKRLF